MFNKKRRRNIRQRQRGSSDEEEGKTDGDGADNGKLTDASDSSRSELTRSKAVLPDSRPETVTCKTDSSGDETANVKKDSAKPEILNKGNVLSFVDERESDGCEFKVKRSAEKVVVFKARRKEDSPKKEVLLKAGEDERPMTASSEPELQLNEADEEARAGSECDTSSLTSNSSTASAPRLGGIPDAQRIRAAKNHRRKARAQKDYIPLDGDQESTLRIGEDGAEGDDGDVEVQQDSDEDDDHQRRIQFAPKSKTIKERIAEQIGASDSDSVIADSEEEGDQKLWEEQQIGKGLKRHKLADMDCSRNTVKHKRSFNIPDALPSVSIDVIKKRITGKLESLKEVHRAHEADRRRMQLDMDDARVALERLESSSADEQNRFYRSMRTYVQNLVECLTEKVMLINAVEVDMHTLFSDQAEALLSRRREAVRRESSRLQRLAYNTDLTGSGAPVDNLAEIPAQRQACDPEWSGDVPADEEPLEHEKAEMDSKRAEILRRSEEIFADVQEDFSDVRKILSRFCEWRELYPESYYNAYIALCLPKLLSPIVRHQLVGWNPLKVNGEDFETLPWYSAVENFCHRQGYEESENRDRETLPSIIQKTVLPKIQGYVELVWDPLSSAQSHSLVQVCRRLQGDHLLFGSGQSQNAKAFLKAVIARLRSAVDEDVFIPLYPKSFLDDQSSQHCRFQDGQFWSAVELLGGITLWDGLVPESVVMELALDKLLNRYLMMILLNMPSEKESLDKSRKIAAAFPKSWFEGVETQHSIAQLHSFSHHVLQTTLSLCKDQREATTRREIVADVLALLRSIKDLDGMNTLAEKYPD